MAKSIICDACGETLNMINHGRSITKSIVKIREQEIAIKVFLSSSRGTGVDVCTSCFLQTLNELSSRIEEGLED
jgi:hypothetical protein